MKILLFVFLFAFSDAAPGYSDSTNSENDIGQGSSGGSYSYSGSTSGADFPSGNFPSFVPFVPQFDFSSFFEQLNRQHQEFIKHGGGAYSYSYASSSPGSSAQAKSSVTFDGLQRLAEGQAQAGFAAGPGTYAPGYQGAYQGKSQGAGAPIGGAAGGYDLGNRGGFVGGYGGGFSGPDGNSYSFSGPIGSDSAFASGSIGPQGTHQTAAVFPENPNSPNINTRFGDAPSDGGGYKSVFTSSKSVTTNLDGKPQTFRQASTTINDNGKVTTYTAHNP